MIKVDESLLDKVKRVEVIDSKGRAYGAFGIKGVEIHLQDEGRTLKVFVRDKKESK